jgi:hypothetical protein
MTAFKKFDPHAFLERERLAPDSTTAGQPLEPDSTTTLATLAGLPLENEIRGPDTTLATLATLAGLPFENEIRGKVLSDTGAVTAKSIEIQRDHHTVERGLDQLGKNQNLTPTPAKVAKVAKDRSHSDSLPAAFGALERGCPAYIDVADWQQAIEDGHKFLARWGEQAEALGWTTPELFGLDAVPERPAATYRRLSRYDESGLIWLLRGKAVIGLTAGEAVIRVHSGATVSYRKLNKPALGPLGDSLDDMGPTT